MLDQPVQHLAHPVFVGHDDHGRRRLADADRDTFRARRLRVGVADQVNELGEADGDDVQLDAPRLDGRKIEHVVHEREQTPTAAVDHLDVAALLQHEGARASFEEQLRQRDDGVERRAQVMAHSR